MRQYKRKTTKGTYSRQAMLDAVNSVLNKNRSLRDAAEEHGVNYRTLSRYVVVKKRGEDLDENCLGYKQPRLVFSKELEAELVDYLVKASKIFHGLTLNELRQLAYQTALKNKLEMPDSWIKDQSAGVDWARGFMTRHEKDLSIRQPEPTSLQRMSGFNHHNVTCFYDNLEKAMEKGFTADGIWNIDETGVSTVQKPVKQIAPKGERRVGSVTGQERGDLVTVCNSINALGNHMPPFLVFPRVKAQDHWLESLPPGSKVEGHPKASGWMTKENFLSFLEHFKQHSKPSPEAPVLLLLDNHASHISLEAIEFCRGNNITLLSFPPHCSHELQPLDKTVYGPFKTFCNQFTDNWYRRPENAGRSMSIHIIPSVVNYGFTHAFNQRNIVSGFRSTGIYPFDRRAIPEDRFLPSFTTDRPDPTASTENNSESNRTGDPMNEPSAQSSSTPEASGSGTSVHVSPFEIRPFGQAGPRSPSKVKRRKVSSEIYTSTPVKKRLEEQFAVKKKPVKSKKVNREREESVSSSDDESSKISLHDDSNDEIEEMLSSESDGEKNQLNFDLSGVKEDLKIGDFVLVEYKTKRSTVYYVGQVQKEVDDEKDVEIDFLRKSQKSDKFLKPKVQELASVPVCQIKRKLTRDNVGTTSRTRNLFSFKENLFNDVLKIY